MLSDEQINQLFVFCERHRVVHYDLQVELVDHLANAVEEKLAADPDLSFEKALAIVYDSFGVMGFAGIVKERAHALEKQYGKQRRKAFRSYFTWPKAAFTICLFLALFTVIKVLPGKIGYYGLWALFIATFAFDVFSATKASRSTRKRKLMIIQSATTESVLWNGLIGAPFGFLVSADFSDKLAGEISAETIILISFLTLFFLATLSFINVIRQTVDQAKKDFPEVFSPAG